MNTEEIIKLIEENTAAKYKSTESIPMGRSIHFVVKNPDAIKEQMLKVFGRDFNIYEGKEAIFIKTNNTELLKS